MEKQGIFIEYDCTYEKVIYIIVCVCNCIFEDIKKQLIVETGDWKGSTFTFHFVPSVLSEFSEFLP